MTSAEQSAGGDIEKLGKLQDAPVDDNDISTAPTSVTTSRFSRWNAKIENLAGLEARGITRVLPEERHAALGWSSYMNMFTLWFGMNLCALSIVPGFLGPLVFNLGWIDCICIVIFATALSACGPAYMATFGADSGNRTMILGRYFMGYWPSKLPCLFNIIMQIGWGIIGAILAGQMLSAVNGAGLTVAAGCVIGAVGIGVIATFGIGILHEYERYAWIPQSCVLLILIGSSGRNWNTGLTSVGPTGTIMANRCSFFALQFSTLIGFSAVAADFYVYCPTKTSRPLIFLSTWLGLWLSLVITNIIGVGIATGVATTPAWAEAYAISSGALLLECYNGLGGLGGFCVVILALGSIANNAPSTYSAANTCQVLGRYAKNVPRWAWCVILVSIELICSVVGRNNLYNIFLNFLPIMSYWVCPWLTVALEEHVIFHMLRGIPFDWSSWEDRKRLPIGVAAMLAWLAGWAGAIIGMSQVWYQGPVGRQIGGYGGDIGAWLAIAFSGLVYPPLRYIEIKASGGR